MKRKFLAWLIALLGVPLLATVAHAQQKGYTTTSVNLRAGPGGGYPVVTTVPPSSPVTIYGCDAARTWCDISWTSLRGWMSATYIYVDYGGSRQTLSPALIPLIGLGVVAFNQAYWDRYYPRYPWYSNWNRYYRPPPPPYRPPPYYRPPPPHHGGPPPPHHGGPPPPHHGGPPPPHHGGPPPPHGGPPPPGGKPPPGAKGRGYGKPPTGRPAPRNSPRGPKWDDQYR